jgi:hypothetical protein
VFIKVNTHTYINIYVYTIFLKKQKICLTPDFLHTAYDTRLKFVPTVSPRQDPTAKRILTTRAHLPERPIHSTPCTTRCRTRTRRSRDSKLRRGRTAPLPSTIRASPPHLLRLKRARLPRRRIQCPPPPPTSRSPLSIADVGLHVPIHLSVCLSLPLPCSVLIFFLF